MRRIPVCLTVDTEFSIGGAFADPGRNRPVGARRVTCPVDSKEEGLGFLLDIFRDLDIPATFFVEALNTHYFGDDEMGSIARRIASAGHDVQLHLHPMWRVFRDADWAERAQRQPPSDSLVGRSQDEITAIIEEGLAVFQRWGMAPPVALRVGNFQVDSTLYAAMAQTPLRLASSIGLGAYAPPEPELQRASGLLWRHGILEVPVLTYRSLAIASSAPRRVLGIGSTSTWEFKSLMLAAHAADIGPVLVVIHPFLLTKSAEPQMRRIRRNIIIQRRSRAFCEFLRENSDRFELTTFSRAAPSWLRQGDGKNVELSVGAVPAIARMVVNKLNDLV